MSVALPHTIQRNWKYVAISPKATVDRNICIDEVEPLGLHFFGSEIMYSAYVNAWCELRTDSVMVPVYSVARYISMWKAH